MRRSYYIIIISVSLLLLAIVSTLWLDSDMATRIVNIITITTGVIGILALFFEFRRNKKINTATFLEDYSKSFFNCDYDLVECFSELEKCAENKKYKLDYDKYAPKIAVYLQWVEAIASLVERRTINLYTIDNALSYRFFIIVNNPVVQQKELLPNAQFYRGTFYLYDKWYKFEQKRKLEMPLDNTALRHVANYDDLVKSVFHGLDTKR